MYSFFFDVCFSFKYFFLQFKFLFTSELTVKIMLSRENGPHVDYLNAFHSSTEVAIVTIEHLPILHVNWHPKLGDVTENKNGNLHISDCCWLWDSSGKGIISGIKLGLTESDRLNSCDSVEPGWKIINRSSHNWSNLNRSKPLTTDQMFKPKNRPRICRYFLILSSLDRYIKTA